MKAMLGELEQLPQESGSIARPITELNSIRSDAAFVTGLSGRLMRDRQTLLHWVQWLTSLGCVIGSLTLLVHLTFGVQPLEYRLLAVAAASLTLIIYRWLGVFHCYASRLRSVLRLSWAWLVVLAALTAILVGTGSRSAYSWQLLGSWAALALAGQIGLFLATHALSNLWQRRWQINMPTLIVGTGAAARYLAEKINRNPFMPDYVAGLVTDDQPAAGAGSGRFPVLGGLQELASLVSRMAVDRVYIVMPVERSDEVARLQRTLVDRNVDVIWAPDISALNPINPCMHELGGVPLIALSESPLCSGGRALIKSMMDVFIASLVLLVLAPLFLVLALLIKLTSDGPIFFRQQRTGWDGSLFEVWKFRSMYVHEEAAGQVTQARRDDDRITPIGRFLRRTSLDELPQLFNVLDGSMSLVGPRPHAVQHNLEYAGLINAYMARHRVKPGITGWAQVHGCRGETDTVEKMQQRVQLDLEYINNWSLRKDLWILLRTPFALFCDTAY